MRETVCNAKEKRDVEVESGGTPRGICCCEFDAANTYTPIIIPGRGRGNAANLMQQTKILPLSSFVVITGVFVGLRLYRRIGTGWVLVLQNLVGTNVGCILEVIDFAEFFNGEAEASCDTY